jgi:hypothetical protein
LLTTNKPVTERTEEYRSLPNNYDMCMLKYYHKTDVILKTIPVEIKRNEA